MNYGVNTVFVPKGMHPRPHDFEISTAVLLSQHFHAQVNFVERTLNKTADLEINGQYWEIKSPTGNSPRTIQNNLRKADDQAENVVMDLSRCKMYGDRAISRIKVELSKATRIKRLLVITKNGKVIVIL